MKRRQFLQLTAAGTLAFNLPAARSLAGARSRMHVLAYPQLLALLGDGQHIREIGSAYRSTFPQENTPEVLSTAILAEGGLSAHLPDAVLRDRLDQQVRQDFARGHTVQLNGWILSRTEARQCALFSILHS